jgi:hypothetical protein
LACWVNIIPWKNEEEKLMAAQGVEIKSHASNSNALPTIPRRRRQGLTRLCCVVTLSHLIANFLKILAAIFVSPLGLNI